jgi:serine/threonine-protein phosphatase 6 regulatory ankyrin repeat subunit B
MKELIEKILLQEIEAVRELLKNPIDWKAESKHPWWPPLNAAVIKGNLEIVKLLLENASPLENVNKKDKMTALHFAASGKHVEIAKLLIEKGADVNAKDGHGNGPLFRAGNCEEIGIMLMKNGADPDMENNSGICPRKNAIVAYEYIRKYLNDTEKYPATSNFEEAAKFGDTFGVTYYLAKGADVNQEGVNALCSAASKGKLELVKILIDAGAKVNETDSAQNTPLFWAAGEGHLEIVKLLVENGANIMAVNKWGISVLDACKNHPEVENYIKLKIR